MSGLETPKDGMHIKTHVVLNPSVLKAGEASVIPLLTLPPSLVLFWLIYFLTGQTTISKMAQRSLYVPKCVGVTLLLLF